MLIIDRSVITDGGAALLNSGDPINITSVKTGSGTYTSSEDIKSRTALKSTQYSYAPSSVSVDGATRSIDALLSNYDPVTEQAIVTTDYTLTEVGLFATVNGADVLFAIGVSYDGSEVPAFTGQNKSEIIVNWDMAVSGTDAITITATGAPALAADLNSHVGTLVLTTNGVHGIRAVKDGDDITLQVKDGGTWKDVAGGGTTIVPIPVQDSSATYTYDGTVQSIAWTTAPTADVLVTGGSATNAGTYTCTCALKSDKAVWSDLSTGNKTFTWTIDKATGTISISPSTATLDADNLTAVLAVTYTGDGGVAIDSSDTSIATASPSVLSAPGNITVTATQATGTATVTAYLSAGTNYTSASATAEITCSFVPIKTFATATDEEIAQMIAAADAGQIDLYDDCGWRVGQEHTTTLGAIAASGTYDGVSWIVGEAQSEQTITLVLMHKGLYDLVTPVLDKQGHSRSKCSFVVGVKNFLGTYGYMNSTDTNTGSWESSARRNWCNGGFRQAFNSHLRGVFKKFTCITGDYNGSAAGGTNKTTQDFFALAGEKEIFGSKTYCTDNEAAALTQFTWYETSANRIKTRGDSGSAAPWWERSPYDDGATYFCCVNHGGAAGGSGASGALGLSPFGCL